MMWVALGTIAEALLILAALYLDDGQRRQRRQRRTDDRSR